MASAKILVQLLYLIGIPVYALGILMNVTTWKSDVLFVVALLLGGLKAYHDIQKNNREERKASQEERLRQIEIDSHEKR